MNKGKFQRLNSYEYELDFSDQDVVDIMLKPEDQKKRMEKKVKRRCTRKEKKMKKKKGRGRWECKHFEHSKI